jgi:hypothetical protein
MPCPTVQFRGTLYISIQKGNTFQTQCYAPALRMGNMKDVSLMQQVSIGVKED